MIINRHAIVPYTTRQMFELVNSVEEYPRFLPWCHSAQILNQTQDFLEAKLDIVWSGFHKSFTTRNTLFPYERMEMRLIEGPFRHFEGIWTFQPLGIEGSKVNLDLTFEFTGSMMDKLFQPIFNHIANSLVDAFCKRAIEIYGTD